MTDTVAAKPHVCVASFKMVRKTNVFNEGQRVWVQMGSGALAAQVTGKYRNRFRWVTSWVNWHGKNEPKPTWQFFDVDEEFAKRHRLYIYPADESPTMTDTATPTESPASPPAKFRLVRSDLPNLVATLLSYTRPASNHLDATLQAAATEGDKTQDVVRKTPHFPSIEEWCTANPRDAARIVMACVYLANGRYVVQEELPPPDAVDEAARAGQESDNAQAAAESQSTGDATT